jgi:hypothetical protein
LPQSNSDGFAIGDSYTDGNAYVHTDGNGHGYGNSYTNTDANGYGYVYADSYSYRDGNCHSYAHTDAYGYSDSNSNSDLNAYSNCGEAFADAETASNDTATASVVGSGKGMLEAGTRGRPSRVSRLSWIGFCRGASQVAKSQRVLQKERKFLFCQPDELLRHGSFY